MNKIYTIIRRDFLGETVVTSELADSQRKGRNSVTRHRCFYAEMPSLRIHYPVSCLTTALSAALLISLPLFAQAGETITFPGSPLQTSPLSGGSSILAPVSSLSDNTVTMSSGNLNSSIYGGISAGNGHVFKNTVTLSGGSVEKSIYGGYSHGGSVTDNKVVITGGQIAGNSSVYGGASSSGEISGNSVTITGGSIQGRVIGGNLINGNSNGVTNNTVTISGNASVKGSVNGGYGPGTIANNHVTISGNASVEGSVSGGYMDNAAGVARGNSVTMTGGTVYGNVYGGFARNGAGSAMDNRVDISGGTVLGNVVGGFARLGPSPSGNIVTLSGNPQFSATNTLLAGGVGGSGGIGLNSYDTFNTLNFSAQPIVVNKVAEFQQYNFTLNPALANTATVLISTNTIELNNGAGTPATFTVVGVHSGAPLQTDDKFYLIRANDMSGQGLGTTSRGVAQQGISLLYDIRTDVDLANNEVTATVLPADSNGDNEDSQTRKGGDNNVDNPGGNNGDEVNRNKKPAARVNPQLKALPAGYLAGAQLVTRGADMIAEEVFGAIKAQEQEQGLHLFSVFSGGHSRYNSGTDIKSDDFLLTGGVNFQYNQFTAGAFIEGGWGNYDTYNSFNNAANVRGDGDNHYYGVGLLGRYDFDNGFYADATARFGQSRNKFDTKDIQNLATGQTAKYEFTTNYVSAHIGLGYAVSLNDKNLLDLSGKYLWTQLGSKDIVVAGDNIHFDSISSQRTRVSARLDHRYNEAVTLNAGIGYEYEFDGKAKATTYNLYEIDAVSVKGGTGILSLGVTVKPTSTKNLTFDFKANGYSGKREGVGASMRLTYAF